MTSVSDIQGLGRSPMVRTDGNAINVARSANRLAMNHEDRQLQGHTPNMTGRNGKVRAYLRALADRKLSVWQYVARATQDEHPDCCADVHIGRESSNRRQRSADPSHQMRPSA